MLDMFVPADPHTKKRSVCLLEPGTFRLARRDASVQSIDIITCAWGRIAILTGTGRKIFYQPSTFTGSFYLGAGVEDGLIVEISTSSPPFVNINWTEEDDRLV